MMRFVLLCILILPFGTCLFAGQESASPARQTQAAPDSARRDSTAQIDSSIVLPDSGASQGQKGGAQTSSQSQLITVIITVVGAFFAALFAWLFARIPRPLLDKNERRYRKALQRELGQIKLVGPGMDDISVRLDDTFVHLRISGEYRAGAHPEIAAPERMGLDGLTPDDLLDETFNKLGRHLLLVIGDPGSGKTTLVKYYTIKSLSKKEYKNFGFKKPVLPIFLPLREVQVENSIAENLQTWSAKHALGISAGTFDKWLQNKQTLVLLDGLDEVHDAEMRRKICAWIDDTCSGLGQARVVVTSRPTGYRGRDKVVLQSDLLQADIRDCTPVPRQEFLQKWFRAAFLRESKPDEESERDWQKGQKLLAERKTTSLLAFLSQPKNKSLRELSGIPMLLQIMAILWKKDDHLPNNRSKLYEIALDYLLEYRDAQRGLDPLLSADRAQRVLSPACLWMQEEWQHEEVQKDRLHRQMQKILQNIPGAPPAKDFCENLRDRAGILADNIEDEYIFRHIPAGAFRYSVTKQTEQVPDIYFAKDPLTNRRYRRFIRYLRAEEQALIEQIPLELFGEKLLDFAGGIQDYREYLSEDIRAWPDKLKSYYDDDRKFNGDDQPVVGVSWFAARAYCFWLSAFAPAPATVYRLPQEIEWEWAAAGDRQNEKGDLREYPWPKEKGEPNDKLANYGRNVGATTPVGRYSEGATPEGLLDVAGNVWEWQENWSSESEKYRALRGGSWVNPSGILRCAARYDDGPQSGINISFRVILAQSLF
jgi:formylglycine-generating enzyme required for sulfatase activity